MKINLTEVHKRLEVIRAEKVIDFGTGLEY